MPRASRISIVLFLEDDKAAAEVMRDLIETSFGDRVIGLVANTVAQARQMYLKYQSYVRVIMVDQGLKTDTLEGEEFVRWIKENSSFTGALVAFSGSLDAVDKLRAAGCNFELPKPLRPPDFIDLVEMHHNGSMTH